MQRRSPVWWPHPEGGFEFGPFGEEALGVSRGVVDGEAGVGETPEGVEDFLVGGALVGEDAAVVHVGEAGDVPGVGGVPGAALGGVAGEPLEGGSLDLVLALRHTQGTPRTRCGGRVLLG